MTSVQECDVTFFLGTGSKKSAVQDSSGEIQGTEWRVYSGQDRPSLLSLQTGLIKKAVNSVHKRQSASKSDVQFDNDCLISNSLLGVEVTLQGGRCFAWFPSPDEMSREVKFFSVSVGFDRSKRVRVRVKVTVAIHAKVCSDHRTLYCFWIPEILSLNSHGSILKSFSLNHFHLWSMTSVL